MVALAVGLAVSISLAQAALVALAAWLVVARRARPALAWPLAGPAAAFAAWTLVAAASAARPLESLAASKSLLALGAFWIVLHALPDRRAAHRFALLLFGLMAVVGLVAVVQVAACPPAPPDLPVLHRLLRNCRRAHGFYSIYMTLAGVLTLVLVATLPRLLRLGREAPWAVPAWLAGVAGLALTYTRGAWVGFAVGVLGSAVGARRWRLAAAGLVAVTAAALLLLPGVRGRALTMLDPGDETARERVAMLRTGLRLVAAHPVTGVGPGQVKHLYPGTAPPEALRRTTSHLHNTPLQILVERGAPGLLAWLGFFAAFFIRAARALRRAREAEDRDLVLGITMAVAAFLVAGLFEYNFGDTEVLLVATSLMALPFVIERDASQRTAPAAAGPVARTDP